MGSSLQEVFQGGGGKKGKGIRINSILPFLPSFSLLLSWLGLLAGWPSLYPSIWFPFTGVLVMVCGFLDFRIRRKKFSVEFLFSLCLVLTGAIIFLSIPWLHLVSFPAVIIMAAWYRPKTIISFSLLIPFIELQRSMKGISSVLMGEGSFDTEIWIEESAMAVFLMLTALIAALMFDRLRKEKGSLESSLKKIRDNATEITHNVEMESLRGDEVMSHYFASVNRTDEEILELLRAIKKAVLADAASLFVPSGETFELRCTTEEKGGITTAGSGLIARCMREKKTFSSGELKNHEMELGYQKSNKIKIASVVVVPIIEGTLVSGVLTVDSARYQAFSGIEGTEKTVVMFADHLARILERQRISMMVKRELTSLKILKEESANLVSSLKTEVIVQKLCAGADRIASAQVFFLLRAGKKFGLGYAPAGFIEAGKQYDLKGTFLNMVADNAVLARNSQPSFLGDVSDYPVPIMPFKWEGVNSVLAIPMLYEGSLLGLLVMLSGEKNFLDSFQISVLEVMCNQATTSLANARLHADIEKMATTDGLTGLYNHRSFQERLSGELKRLKRFSEPLSLLLTDIDHFKKINDTYGHPVGDLVLKGVAKIIENAIRDIDIPARYGGEEFAVILPGTDGEGAGKIAERLRQTVMDKAFAADGRTVSVTVSIGIATSPYHARNKEELIERADHALYDAKNQGRNRVVLWKAPK